MSRGQLAELENLLREACEVAGIEFHEAKYAPADLADRIEQLTTELEQARPALDREAALRTEYAQMKVELGTVKGQLEQARIDLAAAVDKERNTAIAAQEIIEQVCKERDAAEERAEKAERLAYLHKEAIVQEVGSRKDAESERDTLVARVRELREQLEAAQERAKTLDQAANWRLADSLRMTHQRDALKAAMAAALESDEYQCPACCKPIRLYLDEDCLTADWDHDPECNANDDGPVYHDLVAMWNERHRIAAALSTPTATPDPSSKEGKDHE